MKEQIEYIDRKELARVLTASPRTVARWIANGAPAIDLSAGTGSKRRALRFSVPAVLEWLDARKQENTR